MTSDITRNSFDQTRKYRAVVAQQGRVTLDADVNEAQTISAEELRQEALDFVGPCGTPDDGYAVTPNGDDLNISAGTMYVGGERVTLDVDLLYSDQPQLEWLDAPVDPQWQALGNPPSQELVYLHLIEHHVSAVEDTPLREVALGGPDTAQRTRLVQHIVRAPSDFADCEDAFTARLKSYVVLGQDFDDDTMRLISESSLQVSFTTLDTDPDPLPESRSDGRLSRRGQPAYSRQD